MSDSGGAGFGLGIEMVVAQDVVGSPRATGRAWARYAGSQDAARYALAQAVLVVSMALAEPPPPAANQKDEYAIETAWLTLYAMAKAAVLEGWSGWLGQLGDSLDEFRDGANAIVSALELGEQRLVRLTEHAQPRGWPIRPNDESVSTAELIKRVKGAIRDRAAQRGIEGDVFEKAGGGDSRN